MGRLIAVGAVAIAACWQIFAGGAVAQQTYPTQTVHFILPYGAASATDITARLFADRLSPLWGKPVVVENRVGGDGLVALNAFVAAHDDHTLFVGPAGAFEVLPYDQDTMPFDAKREVVPIVCISEVVLAISVPASLNVNTLDQLVALARAHPGTLNAAAASGISDFLLFGFIKNMGLEIAHIPYRDIMQAPNDLASGRIQILATSLAVPLPLTQAGKLKILAVTSTQRAPTAPDVPTAKEAGYPALTFESLNGVFGPRGISDKLRESIAADFRKVAESDPIIPKRLSDIGTIMSIRGPAEFTAGVDAQREQLAGLAKVLGLKEATQ
jgi:tripartite-type tricarboxylate transporter receptor subunit TctC